jgi:hypothetical protein
MYSCSLSQASGIDSIPVYWKLDIFPRRVLVLPNGKNLVRNVVEHLSQVLTASLSLWNHYFAFHRREKGNKRSLMTSTVTPHSRDKRWLPHSACHRMASLHHVNET